MNSEFVQTPLNVPPLDDGRDHPRAGNLYSRLQRQGHDEFARHCQPAVEILGRVGDKWSVLVLMLLAERPMRFNEIRRLIGAISQRMLTLTLRGLERDGFVTRTVSPIVPPRVEYSLTDLGQSLSNAVKTLGEWAFAHADAMNAARHAFDRRELSKPESVPDASLGAEID